MVKQKNTIKYRGHEGSIEQGQDGTYKGHIQGFRAFSQYHGNTLEELESEFRAQVNRFHEACACLGVHPTLIDDSNQKIWTYVAFGLVSLSIMSITILFYLYHFPYDSSPYFISEEVVNKSNWFDGISTFFNNFTAPILTFFSFIALLYTIHLQGKTHKVSVDTLDLSARELSATTEANISQAKALEEQTHDAKLALSEQKKLTTQQSNLATQQQFDSMFYSLFSEHNRLLESIKDHKIFTSEVVEKNTDSYFNDIMEDPSLCRYFRTLYQLLKFISKQHPDNLTREFTEELLLKKPSQDEKTYSSLVRSMLPDRLLLALAVNCHKGSQEDHSFRNYYLLVSRYSFLEHLRFDGTFTYIKTAGLYRKLEAEHPNIYLEILAKYPTTAFGKHDELENIKAKNYLDFEGVMENEPVCKNSVFYKWRKDCLDTV